MIPSWRDAFADHAKTAEHKAAIDDARRRTESVAAAYGAPCVAWSGGKDCTVMLHLASQALPSCVAVWSDYGRPEHKGSKVFPQWMAQEIETNAITVGADALHVSCRLCDWPDAVAARVGRCRDVVVHVATSDDHWVPVQQRVMQSLGHDVALVGLRRDEGIGRRNRIDAGRSLNEFPEAWPVAYLSEMDVWAYIVANDLPYCSVYDRQADLTGTYIGLRVTSLFRAAKARNAEASASLDGLLFWRDRPRR